MNTRKKKTRKSPVVPNRKVKAETIVRAEAERAELARDATRLKRAGLTYRQIAQRLACSPGMVHKLVHEGVNAYTAEAKIDAGEMVEGMIAELLKSSQELWIEWERSKQNRERITKKTMPGKRTPQVTELVEGRCGDPRYMQEFRKQMETIAKLRGVVKTDISMMQQFGVAVNGQSQTGIVQRTAAELLAEYAAQMEASYEPPPNENGPKP